MSIRIIQWSMKLVFNLLAIFIPGIWTPFHDLILVALSFGGKISFQKHLQHNNNNYNNNNGDMNRKLHQATSMLDLSLSSRNAYHNYYLHHHNHPNNSQQQQQQRNSHYQQQQSQNHHHASRSRYSLALTSQQQQQQSQTNNYDSLLLTPKPSFNHRRQQQRPPSVASCHYLFSNQSANQQQQQQSKCGRYYGQFMFGSSILMPKSESTLSVPLNVSSSESFNRFGSSTPTTTSVIPNNYQHHHHHQQMISSNKKEFVPGGSNKLFNHGKCSPISINLNKFDSSTNVTINNMPISNDEMSTDIGYNNNDFYHEKDSNAAAIKSGRSATKLFDNIINGITGRSRSVRKSDSDASTFYNRHNLKRSQIAQNQLSNILYNNFYNKKLASSAFGSEIILLSDNEQQQQKHRNSPLFGRRMANDHKNQNRSDHIDIHHNRLKSSNNNNNNNHNNLDNFLDHIVSSLQETNTRSNSCQQLSILNGDADHYHNHLLLKQNLSSLIDESAPLINFNKNNSITDARDGSGEPIYASLPNEEEQVKHDDDMNGDDEIKASGSFSARSTLPDNCQLISVYAHASNNDDELLTDMTTKQQTTSSSKSQNHKSNVESVIKSNATNNQMADLRNLKSDLENFLIEKPSLEPSTLSMAAMYYNRLILNSDSDNAKSGHRQRTKLNRRQSFSTAHELRQRILYNQLNNNNENQMGLIEEENDDHNNHHDNGSINEYSMFTTNFSEIFPFKLDRRISSSEDNLLSIISTIANCGDDNNAEFESPDSNFIQTNVLKENLTNENDENVKIIDHSNGTFIMKRDLNLKNKSAIPRATAHSNASNETLKITIKELKSKKQAQKRTSKSNLNSNQKSKSSLLASNNGNRDARQNAILAKNALLMSGIKTPIIKLPLQSQPPMDLHP
ncbi:hypothetical protein DERP_008904 [Dermatophagoides pteronyssinus]|uniref:Cyclin-dependent serine/threonine-protein kinase DDB_G0292550 n=1 Tax=Dermatophagoides pteronyssinus TaxID=6956 RepID=A0ABQ8JN72_DERPT|nr:hypothetical protein DERP_008904 [Dermatophagoides pteronyssinus]